MPCAAIPTGHGEPDHDRRTDPDAMLATVPITIPGGKQMMFLATIERPAAQLLLAMRELPPNLNCACWSWERATAACPPAADRPAPAPPLTPSSALRARRCPRPLIDAAALASKADCESFVGSCQDLVHQDGGAQAVAGVCWRPGRVPAARRRWSGSAAAARAAGAGRADLLAAGGGLQHDGRVFEGRRIAACRRCPGSRCDRAWPR